MKDRLTKFIISAFACWILAPIITLILVVPITLLLMLLPFIALVFPDRVEIWDGNNFISLSL